MNNKEDQTSAGLNQIFEIINAKGDIGEINKILEDSNKKIEKDLNNNEH
jgi:hypothetical protein